MSPLPRIVALMCALLFLLMLGGCVADPEDDAFARTFIEHVRTQNSAGAAQLEPGSEISLVGWEKVADQGAQLPQVVPDSIVLWESAKLRDEHGRARKFTYHVHAGTRYSVVELWIVSKSGSRYVNTVRITGPLDRDSTL